MNVDELLSDALHRPAAEGVRLVALWWLEQTRRSSATLNDAHQIVRNLVATLRENRELLTGSPMKRELRHLRGLQRVLDNAYQSDAHRAWLESELDLLTPDVRAEAVHLANVLEKKSQKQARFAVNVMRRHFDCCEPSLQSALSRFSIHGTIGVPLNLDPFSAHAAGRLNRHLAKLARAMNDVQDISSKRELKRVRVSLERIGALLFPFMAHLPSLGALYHAASVGLQQLSALQLVTRLEKHARRQKLGQLAEVLDEVRLSYYNSFATEWLGDNGQRALAGSYAALAALQVSVDITQLSNARFTTEFGVPMEIERKFLLSGCPPEAAVVAGTRIEQGWIPGRTLRERLRRSTYPTGVSRYTRTVKFGRGISRVELEEDTDRHLFEVLWPLTVSARVRKRRHAMREGAHTWEIDVFTDRDLVLAEVELRAVDDAVAIPAWLEKWVVREVTDESEYVNANLAIGDDEQGLAVESTQSTSRS